jgi:hypothetical protein
VVVAVLLFVVGPTTTNSTVTALKETGVEDRILNSIEWRRLDSAGSGYRGSTETEVVKQRKY